MPTTDCSHCGSRVDAIDHGASDTMFDWQCPNCREPVLIDGSAKEQQRQRAAREQISDDILALADEIDTPSYQPSRLSVEELEDRLEAILDDVDSELHRRRSQ